MGNAYVTWPKRTISARDVGVDAHLGILMGRGIVCDLRHIAKLWRFLSHLLEGQVRSGLEKLNKVQFARQHSMSKRVRLE